mmetsp:Transcript_4549/g.6820  ORF Transcript_4549/g.6820 Transcript_4549/m.6820 type:complete len:128 (-) Transcript_4549:641-1024(-)
MILSPDGATTGAMTIPPFPQMDPGAQSPLLHASISCGGIFTICVAPVIVCSGPVLDLDVIGPPLADGSGIGWFSREGVLEKLGENSFPTKRNEIVPLAGKPTEILCEAVMVGLEVIIDENADIEGVT